MREDDCEEAHGRAPFEPDADAGRIPLGRVQALRSPFAATQRPGRTCKLAGHLIEELLPREGSRRVKDPPHAKEAPPSSPSGRLRPLDEGSQPVGPGGVSAAWRHLDRADPAALGAWLRRHFERLTRGELDGLVHGLGARVPAPWSPGKLAALVTVLMAFIGSPEGTGLSGLRGERTVLAQRIAQTRSRGRGSVPQAWLARKRDLDELLPAATSLLTAVQTLETAARVCAEGRGADARAELAARLRRKMASPDGPPGDAPDGVRAGLEALQSSGDAALVETARVALARTERRG